MTMTLDEFVAFLTPERRAYVLNNILDGLSDYDNPQNYSQAAKLDHTPSVRASIRNCHIVGRARRASMYMTDVKIRTRRNRVIFVIADQVHVSFKLIDKYLRSKNARTEQSSRFVTQKSLFPEDSVPDVTNVIGGYLPDPLGTDYVIYITCPDGKGNQWQIQLSGESAISFLSSSVTPDTIKGKVTSKEKRVRIRPEAKKERGIKDDEEKQS